MTDAPIGQYIADLAKLLDSHPAPWILEDRGINSVRIKDVRHVEVIAFRGEFRTLAAGLVAAVNLAAGIRP